MAKWNPEKLKNHRGMSGKTGFWSGKKRIYENPEKRKELISEGLKMAYKNGIRPKVFSGKQGGFLKGFIPWNKGTIGIMKSWNKNKKCPQISRTLRERGIKPPYLSGIIAQQNSKEPTSIEKKVYDELKERGILFEKQKLINGRFLVDAYIPSLNLIIEADGNYWHSLDRTVKKDKAENAYLTTCGFNLLRLTETEINNGSFREKITN
jgi:very-short-patch-repair endonuclease